MPLVEAERVVELELEFGEEQLFAFLELEKKKETRMHILQKMVRL